MTDGMDVTSGIKEYVNRDWAMVRQSKEDHWRELLEQKGASEFLRALDRLRDHMKLLHPDWPTAEERADDLRSHIRVAELLRRADRVPVP
jgi:hypothetical protein